jgi:hypothetical protein
MDMEIITFFVKSSSKTITKITTAKRYSTIFEYSTQQKLVGVIKYNKNDGICKSILK